ncbi:hypothetical protein QBC39DRAFT_340982 [Podospora conica]|nr:hypothetical protein QBC39DRAFT_340982 [Schizothecium conicum]
MPPKRSHHRSRSSVDQVLNLLADLPEHQISLLLDDFNHTTSSNVPVSTAITIFDPSTPKANKRSFGRASSPIRTLEAELVRRHSKRLSKRISSAPEPTARPRPSSQLSFSFSPPRFSITIAEDEPIDIAEFDRPSSPQERSGRPSLALSIRPTSGFDFSDRPSTPPERSGRPSLTLSTRPPSGLDFSDRPTLTLSTLPEPGFDFDFDFLDRPKTADDSLSKSQSRAYKRISRPMILSPTATAELHQLLLAFVHDTPSSATSTATSSPVTPDTPPPFSMFAPIQPDMEAHGLDLLEPSPARAPAPLIFGKGGTSPCSMSGIFEVLASH